MSEVFITDSPLQTQALAKKVLFFTKKTNLFCLYGKLGCGKTTFIQGLAKALGVKLPVQSPTFVLIKEYPLTKTGLSLPLRRLIHIDCYRLASEDDFKTVELEEYWSDKKNLVVIEWADRIERKLPRERVDIYFAYLTDQKRKISFKI